MKNKSIFKNYVMNTLLSISSFIFPLITFPYISRILGPDGVGKVSMATSFVSYFLMFAQLGLPVYGVRACAKVRDNREELSKVFSELLYINMLMCIISYVILWGVICNINRLNEDKLLYFVISTSILFNSLGVEWLYKGLEQYSYITIRSLFFKFIALIMMFVLVTQKSDYLIYGAITIFASSASGILNIIYSRKFVDFKRIKYCDFLRHYKAIIIFFAMACATTIYTNLDVVMLGFMKNDTEVGYYNSAVKVKTVLVTVVTSLGTVLLPRLSYYIENEKKEEFLRIIKLAFSFVFFISIPLTVYFIIFARETTLFLSGNEFFGAILPMQLIMPTVVLIGINNLLAIQILVPLGYERKVLIAEIAGSIIDLVVNYLLIPKYGASGASIGTLAAEFFVTIICFLYVNKYTNFSIKGISTNKMIISTIVSAVLCIQIRRIGIGLFGVLILSSTVYFTSYFMILFIFRDEILFELIEKTRIKTLVWRIKK